MKFLEKSQGKYSEAQVQLIKKAGQLIQDLHVGCNKLEAVHDKAESGKTLMANAQMFAEQVVPNMDLVADVCSQLETLVDDADWPLPNSRNYCSRDKISPLGGDLKTAGLIPVVFSFDLLSRRLLLIAVFALHSGIDF